MKTVKSYPISHVLLDNQSLMTITDDIIEQIKTDELYHPMLFMSIQPFDIRSIAFQPDRLNTYSLRVTESMTSEDITDWINACISYQISTIDAIHIKLIDDGMYKPSASSHVDPKKFLKTIFGDNDITYIGKDEISYIKKDDFSKDAVDMDNDELTQYVHQTACDHNTAVDKMATDVEDHINDLNLWKSKLDSFHELSDHQKANIMTSIVDSIYNALDALANLTSEYDERFSDFNQRLFKKFSVLDAYVDGIDERLDDHLDDEEVDK